MPLPAPLTSQTKPRYRAIPGGGWMESSHIAASTSERGMETWLPSRGSADADLLDELPLITARGRDLERNHPLAAGAMQTYRDNIVGHVLRLSAKPDYRDLGWTVEQAREFARQAECGFSEWSESTAPDVEGEEDLLGLTLRMLTGACVNGNAIAVAKWIEGPAHRWATKLLVIEGDRLSTPPELQTDPRVRGGRRLDANGTVVGYYLRKVHPGERFWWYSGGFAASAADYDYVPAVTPWGRRQVFHLADRTRAGQSLGKSIFTPVMKEFSQAGRYVKAELSRAVVQSLVGAFIESALDSNGLAQLFHGASGNKGIAGAEGYWRQTLGEYRPKLKEGALIPLPIGARAKGFENGAPSGQFDQFVQAVERWLGTGLNLPPELISKNFTRSSYSAARSALLEAWRFFHGRRAWLIRKWLGPVYLLWLEEAISAGDLPVTLDDFYANRRALSKARWVFAGRGWVDPTKEVQAAQMRVEMGISTMENECAEQGLDWEEVAEQRAFEQARMKELGLSASPMVVSPSDQGSSVDDSADDPNDDPADDPADDRIDQSAEDQV